MTPGRSESSRVGRENCLCPRADHPRHRGIQLVAFCFPGRIQDPEGGHRALRQHPQVLLRDVVAYQAGAKMYEPNSVGASGCLLTVWLPVVLEKLRDFPHKSDKFDNLVKEIAMLSQTVEEAGLVVGFTKVIAGTLPSPCPFHPCPFAGSIACWTPRGGIANTGDGRPQDIGRGPE